MSNTVLLISTFLNVTLVGHVTTASVEAVQEQIEVINKKSSSRIMSNQA